MSEPKNHYLYGKCYKCEESGDMLIINAVSSFDENVVFVRCECGQSLYMAIGNKFENTLELENMCMRILDAVK